MSRTGYKMQGYSLNKKSRYYLDPSQDNSKVKIVKKKDPKLMEKNRSILESSKKEADRLKTRYIRNGTVTDKDIKQIVKVVSAFGS